MKCKGSGDPWIATRIAAYGGSRVVLKADQEVAIADVQRHVVAVRSGANEQPRGRFAKQRQSGERSSESARSDKNAKGHIGEA